MARVPILMLLILATVSAGLQQRPTVQSMAELRELLDQIERVVAECRVDSGATRRENQHGGRS
jgi:hypothetical protein